MNDPRQDQVAVDHPNTDADADDIDGDGYADERETDAREVQGAAAQDAADDPYEGFATYEYDDERVDQRGVEEGEKLYPNSYDPTVAPSERQWATEDENGEPFSHIVNPDPMATAGTRADLKDEATDENGNLKDRDKEDEFPQPAGATQRDLEEADRLRAALRQRTKHDIKAAAPCDPAEWGGMIPAPKGTPADVHKEADLEARAEWEASLTVPEPDQAERRRLYEEERKHEIAGTAGDKGQIDQPRLGEVLGRQNDDRQLNPEGETDRDHDGFVDPGFVAPSTEGNA